MTTFVHFDVRSEYSMGESVVRLPELAAQASELGQAAVGIADSNLHGMIQFYRTARRFGVKPIIGMGVPAYTNDPSCRARLVLVCMNDEGYRNLLRINAVGQRNETAHGAVPLDQVLQNANGLAALSGGQLGLLGRTLAAEAGLDAFTLAEKFGSAFPERFYVEIARVGRPNEERYIAAAVNLASDLDLPLLATNEVCFLRKDEFAIQKIRSCISTGELFENENRRRDCEALQYLRSSDDMASLFKDLPDALENSAELARRCHQDVTFGASLLPRGALPEGESENDALRRHAKLGLEEYLKTRTPLPRGKTRDDYRERLEYELETIISMGFAGYFLIVEDIVRWAKSSNIPVGPGRGSGSASLVSFAIGITGVDPLEYELVFERLLNPERVSLPDFDIDFCEERRGEVIEYVAEKFGKESVGQIATYNTLAARAVIRDIGRVLGKRYSWTDALANLVPSAPGILLQQAVEQVEQLRRRQQADEDVAEVLELGKKLEGLIRSRGRHAAGIVIAPGRLERHIPFYTETPSGTAISQFDKNDVESAGLVKFDFLGLTTLTIIDRALKAANVVRGSKGEPPLAADDIPLDDLETFRTIQQGRTLGVFQLESEGMRRIIADLKPDCMDDIVALLALYRPGPLESGAVEKYIQGKRSKENIKYLHPKLQPVLVGTYGEMLYQEDVMNVSRAIAGFSLGEADLMRKAMGRKDPRIMKELREKFVREAAANNVPKPLAGKLFDAMEKFSGYAFNKAHAAGYAVLAFQTAWLKTHYPAQFFAALMSSCMSDSDKLRACVAEVRRCSITMIPPNVNASRARFHATASDRINYALAGIKRVGEDLSEAIVTARESGGEFTSLFDFCKRVTPRVPGIALDALVKSGALDALGGRGAPEDVRPRLLAMGERARLAAESSASPQKAGMSLFDETAERETALEVEATAWTPRQLAEFQQEVIGFRLEGHAVSDYVDELSHLGSLSASQLVRSVPEAKMLAQIDSIRTSLDRNKQEFARLKLSDHSGQCDALIFSGDWSRVRENVELGSVVLLTGKVGKDRRSDAFLLTVSDIVSIEEARVAARVRIVLTLNASELTDESAATLVSILQNWLGKGREPILEIEQDGWVLQIGLGKGWTVIPSDQLMEELAQGLSQARARFEYSKRRS